MGRLARVIGNKISPGGSGGAVNIFRYHGIVSEDSPAWLEGMKLEDFERQMKWIKANMSILPIGDVFKGIQERCFPERAACITFDDGYRSTFDLGLSILESLCIPATFFISSRFLNGDLMWNDAVSLAIHNSTNATLETSIPDMGSIQLRNSPSRDMLVKQIQAKIKYLPYLHRDKIANQLIVNAGIDVPTIRVMLNELEVKSLHKKGMTIGSHTFDHIILSTATESQVTDQISRDKKKLEGVLGAEVRYFAYPNGIPGRDFNCSHSEVLGDLGFDLAVTTAPSIVRVQSNPLRLPRFTPWAAGTLGFQRQLLQNYFR